ncbi:protease modulator HflK [Croceicoccus sp. Ery5]|jgi:modulator of FtsH protease HflK|uniref:protease modulator HflK n=1 Tax=Croceicoccus sp. Ery5 TaxID=1703340 RepID=UPI001E54A6D9|nr:protease modulator HflK [Croceicoccus sp. Ery5]
MKEMGGSLKDAILGMVGRNPWGSAGGGSDEPPSGDNSNGGDAPASDGDGTPPAKPASKPKNPWLPEGGAGAAGGPRRAANIEDLFGRRGQRGGGPSGGGGGNFPRMPQAPGGKSWVPLVVVAVAALWLLITSFHMIDPKEQGIVTTFGKYEKTLSPGVSFTLPWPIQQVDVEDVTSIRRDTIPEGEGEKLMLTGDQNLVDLSYLIRWNIKDLKLYKFQLAEPDETVKEVAEAAMRASVAEVTLDQALSGSGRAEIERSVAVNMQALLDAYRAGINIQGVEIKKADPPGQVIDSFRKVLSAQQEAEADINRARAWAEQVTARAEGEAQEFNEVYQQYRLAPEVTRRRMYYETMERVLRETDKTVVEADGVVPYLPLPEARRGSRAATAQAPRTTQESN